MNCREPIVNRTNFMKQDTIEKIKQSIESIRPVLQADGGDIEFVEFDEKQGRLDIRMTGMCSHCPMSQYTLQNSIANKICGDIKEVKDIRSV